MSHMGTFEDAVAALQTPHALRSNTESIPNYWTRDSQTLLTSANVHSITLGTGESIYANIGPSILSAEHEVIIVTCFWARSKTLDIVSEALRSLSAKALSSGKVIRVRICFSSSSLWQKLLHTSSLQGQTYAPSRWEAQLGLPAPAELAGLEIKVKSIFVLPFSVMHPKFIVIDRATSNSEQLVRFWQSFWADSEDQNSRLQNGPSGQDMDLTHAVQSTGVLHASVIKLEGVPAFFLPSPHHRNPQFRFPWQRVRDPPPTPLNIYIQSLFARAQSSIYIQTPNLTSPPVLSSIVPALARGVNVKIVTSEKLMVLEQLVTAGTTTSRCIKQLTKDHEKLLRRSGTKSAPHDELEAGLTPRPTGSLSIQFYQPALETGKDLNEPVQSHLKLMMMDDKIAVFGSGNMDRASWYTSQELGVALISQSLVSTMKEALSAALEDRLKTVYPC